MESAGLQLHRLSVEDVFRMVEAGVLREEDRVELVDGVLLDMSPPGTEHSAIVAWLTKRFASSAGDHEVRVQDLLLVPGGFVMPDLMVVEPLPRDRHPSTALLVVEVAVTTRRHDTWKAGRYAAAGVGEYWLVDVPARVVRVHRRPSDDGYREVVVQGRGARLGAPVGSESVDVAELLG